MLLLNDDLYLPLQECPAERKLVIIDACHKELLSNDRTSRGLPGHIPEPSSGVVLLTSCDADQYARELPEKKHGVFFFHVLEALRAAPPNGRTTRLLFRVCLSTQAAKRWQRALLRHRR